MAGCGRSTATAELRARISEIVLAPTVFEVFSGHAFPVSVWRGDRATHGAIADAGLARCAGLAHAGTARAARTAATLSTGSAAAQFIHRALAAGAAAAGHDLAAALVEAHVGAQALADFTA